MSLKDRIFGKRPETRETTTEPPAQSRDEAIHEVRRNTGMAARDLMNVLRGRKRQPVHVCSEGHPVKPGDSMCSYGHAA